MGTPLINMVGFRFVRRRRPRRLVVLAAATADTSGGAGVGKFGGRFVFSKAGGAGGGGGDALFEAIDCKTVMEAFPLAIITSNYSRWTRGDANMEKKA